MSYRKGAPPQNQLYSQGAGYPTAPPGSYPTQPYPAAGVQGPPPPYYPPQGMNRQPAYAQVPYPQQPYGAPPPYTPVQPQQPQHPQQPPVVMAQGLFDSGARFDGGSQARIPPPPPGVAPNAAQVATMQGHTVVGTQRKSDWLVGGDGGGVTFW